VPTVLGRSASGPVMNFQAANAAALGSSCVSARRAPGAEQNPEGVPGTFSAGGSVALAAQGHEFGHLVDGGDVSCGEGGLGVLDPSPRRFVGEQLDRGLERLEVLGCQQHDVLASALGDVDALVRAALDRAGLAANETLVAGMRAAGTSVDATSENAYVDLPAEVGVGQIQAADVAHALPHVTPDAVVGLKFSAALPSGVATATLAERFADRVGAGVDVGGVIVVQAPVADLIRRGGGARQGSDDRGPTVETSARPSPEPHTS
jgi:hypothetical protein